MRAALVGPAENFWRKRVASMPDAVKFIDAAGFCLLFPVDEIPLPSLYYAVTRRRLHKDWIWDKYSDMVWSWKDDLPRRRKAFYAKYFRGRGTLISLEQLPNFLCLCDSAVPPDAHEDFYEAGRISEHARTVWRALQDCGPMATLELRHACKMETAAGNIRYKRAILELQKLLIVVHSGAEQETGAWASARFDLTARAFPKQVAAARELSAGEARRRLAAKFVGQHKDADARRVARLFGWSKATAVEALAAATNGHAVHQTRRTQ
jgi:hypothetical protein